MKTTHSHLGVVQNESAIDRTFRALVGGILIVAAVGDLVAGATVSWHAYAILVAIYPLMTSILGWDPLYQLTKVKSCDSSAKNRCGTFPFEVAALFGRKPRCNSEYDCQLSSPDKLKDRHSVEA